MSAIQEYFDTENIPIFHECYLFELDKTKVMCRRAHGCAAQQVSLFFELDKTKQMSGALQLRSFTVHLRLRQHIHPQSSLH
jgi:hypothetical protein